MFRRILVANRGEIALRIIRACEELGIETTAVYSTADAGCLHVERATRKVCIGPPDPRRSYLSVPNLISAAKNTGCEAVHPGYGFLAENAAFAEACQANGLVFIGPRAETIRSLGDKALAKRMMADAGLPILPGSPDVVSDAPEARAWAERLGYPVVLKAAAGGGGRGMRVVESPAELERHFQAAAAEAEAAFGSRALYVEKVVRDPRHVEIQVIGDGEGAVATFVERDCSLQRRHQKILEESPSPVLAPQVREAMQCRVAEACARLGYAGAGTVEFLLDAEQNYYFMEMNTRVQVEHPVTEMVSGADLIKEQIRVAAGEGLSSVGPQPWWGHAVEFRINAEDPTRDFAPRAGAVTRLRLPGGPGVRVDTHLYQGYVVPPYYDSLLAKVVVWDQDRERCLARGQRCLRELVIEGVPTTRDLHLDILRHPEFIAGRYSTGFLASSIGRSRPGPSEEMEPQ
jgi:acetyl-CoA carboxylase biotin carboxylase subunit